MSSIMSSRLWSLHAALLHAGILRLLCSFWLHLRNHLTGPLVHARIPSSGNVAPAFAPASNMLLTRVLLTIVARVFPPAPNLFKIRIQFSLHARSEERRVGKECRS